MHNTYVIEKICLICQNLEAPEAGLRLRYKLAISLQFVIIR